MASNWHTIVFANGLTLQWRLRDADYNRFCVSMDHDTIHADDCSGEEFATLCREMALTRLGPTSLEDDVLERITEAKRIFNSDKDWEHKYDKIFGLKIWQKVNELGYTLEWCDPDASYEDDVKAYMQGLIKFEEMIRGNDSTN